MGTYVPNRIEEQKEMLSVIGATTIEDLFQTIPGEVRLNRPLNLPKGLSELEVSRYISEIAKKNKIFPIMYRGCGAYHHYIPSIVKQITSKEEFVTAYTPYQAEISQGILQSIFEYQTMICELTGMEASNASVYDGACAAAEAVIMTKEKKRRKALISTTVHPQTIEVIQSTMVGTEMEVVLIPQREGRTDLDALQALVDGETACVLTQQPNYYGLLEDGEEIGKIGKELGAKYIMSCNPTSLGILKTPFEYGADIAVGEGQPLGIPLSFGGPYLGFMATTNKLIRRLPGRIAGETKDQQGRRAYVLTLQAREQHIRRENASSNICSNQALCAMMATVYLGAMGKEGLRKVATNSMSNAHYLADRLCSLNAFTMAHEGEYFHEFVTNVVGDVDKILDALEQRGILGGYPIHKHQLLWCATEMNTKVEIDQLVDILKEVV